MSDAPNSGTPPQGQTEAPKEPTRPVGPLKNPLLNRVGAKKERKHFDSADWAMSAGQDKR